MFYSIDATPYPEEYGRYANDQHEKFATAQVKRVLVDQIPYLAIVAKKKLYPGMEVTYDYGDKKAPWRVKVIMSDFEHLSSQSSCILCL